MATIKNLIVKLGLDFDDSGAARLTKGIDRLAGRVTRLSGAMDKARGPAFATALLSGAGAATSFAAALAPASAAALALPAAMAASKLAAATLKVGMTGVGEAMSAVADGDAKKLNAALKELSPNAQKFVRESAKFTKGFEPIRKAVQDRLFDGLDKSIGKLSTNLLPTASKGMNSLATGFNKSAREAIKFGASPVAKGALNAVFKTTSGVMTKASTAVQPLLKAVAKIVVLGLPLAKRMADWAINGVKAGAAFVTSAEGSKKLAGWVQKAGDLLAKLGRIGKNLAVGLGGVFSQANTDSSDFLGTIERLTAKFAKWAQSAEGQQQAANAFKLLGDVAKQLASVLPLLMGPLGAIAKLLSTMPPDVQGTVTTFIAFGVIAGALGGKLAVLAGVGIKATSAVLQFGAGVVKGSAGLANNASMASKAGAAARTFGGVMASGVKTTASLVTTLSASAGGFLLNTTRMVASKVAMIATTVASKAMAIGIRLVNAAMRANPIGIVITLIMGLVAIIVLAYKKNETFRKIVDNVWKAIQTAIRFAIDKVIKPVIQWLYNFIVNTLGPKFMWFHRNVVEPVMNKIGEIIRTVVNKVKGHFEFMVKLVTQTIPNAFRTGVAAIGKFWSKVQEVAKKPIAFIVNTVYNKGIATVWNWVADKTGLGRINYIQGFASGGVFEGVLPGYSRKDNQLIAARSGESVFVPEFTKAVGSNWVNGMNALASRGGPRAVAKAMTGGGMGIPGYEKGGVVGFVQGFFTKAKDFFVNGFIKAAQAVLNPIVSFARNAVGGTGVGKLLVSAVDKIVGGVLATFKPYESELGGGGAMGVVKAAARYLGQGDRGRDNDNKFNDRWGHSAGTPWCANFVSSAVGDAKAGSKYAGYPTAAVYGYYSRMKKVGLSAARPGDLGVYNGPTGHINVVERKLAGNGFTTIGGNEGPVVRRATRSSAYAILRPSFEKGGVFDRKSIFQQKNLDPADKHNPMRLLQAGQLKPFLFDNGGVWEPGTLGFNGTREPEYVFNRRQASAMASQGISRDHIEIHNHIAPGAADIRAFEEATYKALVNYKKRNRGTVI